MSVRGRTVSAADTSHIVTVFGFQLTSVVRFNFNQRWNEKSISGGRIVSEGGKSREMGERSKSSCIGSPAYLLPIDAITLLL